MPIQNPQLTRLEFAQKIKDKYPAYAEIDDNELVDKILEKYPQYSEQIKADEGIDFAAIDGGTVPVVEDTSIGETVEVDPLRPEEVVEPTSDKPEEYIDDYVPVTAGNLLSSFLVVDPNTGEAGIKVPNIDLDFLKRKPGVDEDPDNTTAAESLTRTWNNTLDQLSLTDDRFIHLSEQLFGDFNSINYRRAKAEIGDKEAAQQAQGQTLRLEDIPSAFKEKGIGSGLAHTGAAVTNAISAFGVSAIQSVTTGGVALATDMVQGSVQEYTQQRANELGISYEEAAETLGNEMIVPISLGALSYKFEKAGIKGVGEAINAITNKAKQTFFTILNAGGKEGLTELAQGTVEAFNRGHGKKNSWVDAVDEVVKFYEEEALETTLQGIVGGSGSAGGGRAIRNVVKAVAKNRSAENIDVLGYA